MAHPSHCCGETGYFCDILSTCLPAGGICQLPNIPPIVSTPLIHLGSSLDLDSESGDSHVISELLSNGSGIPAVDSQGEEVSIAIVAVSAVSSLEGEWQFGLCSNSSSNSNSSEGEDCALWVWSPVGVVSETHALVLPSVARLRFVRRGVALEGVVWVRVRLWDGNEEGYLSPASDLVRHSHPHTLTTLPFSENGPFSQNHTLVTLLLLPLLPLPSLPPSHHPTLTSIDEDTPITTNYGNTVREVVSQIVVPELPVLPDNVIGGFPESFSFAEFESREPAAVREYLERVQRVNPTRQQRQSFVERGLGPGIGIRSVSEIEEEVKGRWQVSWNGDVRRFVYVSSLLSATNQILLLNTTAQIRFVPKPDFCGQVSIPFQPWDGYWNETETNLMGTGFLVAMDTIFSEFNLNEVVSASITVECLPDKPVLLVDRLQLEPIPYYITHTYDRLFTVIVSVETSMLRGNQERLSELLHLTLEQEVTILRVASHHHEMR